MNVQEAYSQSEFNWKNFTPPPCNEGLGQVTEDYPYSDDPKSFRFCPDGPNGCCFTIIYYDRMYPATINFTTLCQDRFFYDVSVTGIFYENEGCKNYNKDIIIDKFHLEIYKLNSKRKGFRDSVTICCHSGVLVNGESNIQTVYKCINTSGNQCEPNVVRCCNRQRQPNFVLSGDSCIFTGWYFEPSLEDPTPPCPTGCIPKCNDVLMENIGKLACEMPCDSGETIYFTEEVIIDPACPECKFTVTYKMNNTYCHPYPSYMDFEIVGITYNPIPCTQWPCDISINSENLYILAMNHILTNFTVNYNLVIGKCIENIRVIKSPCFKNITLPTGNVSLQPCEQEYCCILNVKICKSFTGQITYEYVELNNNQESCPSENNQVCLPYCFEDLLVNSINIIKFDKTNENNKFKKGYKNEK